MRCVTRRCFVADAGSPTASARPRIEATIVACSLVCVPRLLGLAFGIDSRFPRLASMRISFPSSVCVCVCARRGVRVGVGGGGRGMDVFASVAIV